MATIKDIAQEAGVSVGTVSKALNQGSGVSVAKVKAVEKAIAKLGYNHRPNRSRTKNRKNAGIHTGKIVLLSLDKTPEQLYRMPAMPMLLQGIQEKTNQQDLNLVLAQATDVTALPAILQRNEADGVILLGGSRLASEFSKKAQDIPAVWCFHPLANPRLTIDQVYYDNSYIGELAAEYLFEKGRGHFAFINPRIKSSIFEPRRNQFLRRAAELGVEVEVVEPDERPHQNDEFRIAKELTESFLSTTSSVPAGVFCPADDIMLAVHNVLHKHGIEPGRDIDLIGCNNDYQFMKLMHPRPATIDIKLTEVGRKSVEQLLRRMANPKDKSQSEIKIPPEVVPAETQTQTPEIRETTPEPEKAALASDHIGSGSADHCL